MSLKNKPYFIATGASSGDEVVKAVDTALAINPNIALMQCNTNYTASLENFKYIQLNVLKTYRAMYPEMILGLSDHTPGHSTVLGAVALGARVFEKHFTLNKKMKGPDHSASIDPDGLKSLIQNLKRVPKILGNYDKKMQACEIKNINSVRKSVVAKKLINRGEIFSLKNLTSKRPGNKFNPINIKSVLGKKAKKDFAIDEAISL